jgi:hypothetical protein
LTRAELLAFLRRHRYAVQATVSSVTGAQAAVVGIAVADNFDIVFDTIDSSRKARNLVHDQRVAMVIGGLEPGEEETVQLEGVAERLASADKRVVEELYFRVFPDGRDRLSWQGIMHIRVRPHWLRYSDFRAGQASVLEFNTRELAALE